MKLPNADYTRGMSGLGREGTGAAASFEVASRTNLETANAKNAVYNELQKLGGAVNDWSIAQDATAADEALSTYRIKVREIQTVLDTTPVYKADELPDGIQYRREESVNGTKQLRELIPAWEVRAQLYDYHEKQARTDALNQPAGAKRPQLLQSINELNSQAVQQEKNAAFEGQHEFMVAQRNALVERSVQAGDIKQAESLIANGAELGLYSIDGARQMVQEAWVQHETLTYGRAIQNAQTPEQLEALSLDIPQQAQWLSPAQSFALSQAAETRAIQLDNKRTAAYEKAVTQASAQKRADVTLGIATSGKPIGWDTIAALNLTPADQNALIAVNKAASETRATHSDPGTLSEIQSGILGLSTPNPAPIHARRQQLQNRITAELNANQLTAADASTLYGRVQSTEGDLFTTENYKTALELGYTKIVGGNPSSASFFGGDAAAKGRAVDYELELRQAAQNGADPLEWMQKNVTRFQAVATPQQNTWAQRDSSGAIDKQKSLAKIREDYSAGRIDKTTADKRERDLELIR